MGKAALILVLGSVIAMAFAVQLVSRTEIGSEDEQAFYEEKVLARERAYSALNIAVANLQSDYDGYRSSGVHTDDGVYSIELASIDADLIAVKAIGYAGRSEYQIVGEMVRTGTALFSALTIDGPLADASGIGGDYQITGKDTMPTDADGEHTGLNAYTHGIHTTWPDADPVAQSGFRPELVTGINGEADYVTGPTELDLELISQNILNHPACVARVPPCHVYDTDQRWTGTDSFGSPEEPAIVIVHGDAVMRGSVQGHGILYVTGDFKTEVGQPHWQGLVYANGVGAHHELRGEPRIDGAIVFRGVDEAGSPGSFEEPPPPMTVTIRGNVSLNYSSYALSESNTLITGLDAGTPDISLQNVRPSLISEARKAGM